MANRIIEGYAILWNVSYPMGGYMETIHPDALKNADLTDIKVLRDHNQSLLLGRNASGTLKTMIDQTGLFFRVTVPDSSLGNETADLVARRDLSQCSWGFTSDENEDSTWTQGPSGVPRRTIMHVHKVYDISLVTFPANPMTKAWTSEARSEDPAHVPDIEPYQSVLNHIENSRSTTMQPEFRSKAKTGANIPFYECNTLQIQNEARHSVMAKAREIATGKKDDPTPEKDGRAELAARQAKVAFLQEKHAKEYHEAGERYTKEHEAALEREEAKKRPISNERMAEINAKMRLLADRERQQSTPKIITSW
jgi:HK97 family phage prohead protease